MAGGVIAVSWGTSCNGWLNARHCERTPITFSLKLLTMRIWVGEIFMTLQRVQALEDAMKDLGDSVGGMYFR